MSDGHTESGQTTDLAPGLEPLERRRPENALYRLLWEARAKADEERLAYIEAAAQARRDSPQELEALDAAALRIRTSTHIQETLYLLMRLDISTKMAPSPDQK